MDNTKPNNAVGLPPGARIGKYEVKQRLAMGGQAIIYRCYDSLLDREVAIKQISSHLAEDPKFLERFRREAQILARLGAHQQAIVTIHELIEDERGLFIVMEYVAGLSLEEMLQANPQPVEPKAVLQILWRLAAALNNVHAAGIVHRDIKPGNIIVCEGLRPKIADFGVAASLTGQTSMLLGTTKYMAPELLNGESFDGRADMYSLGFIAYEMLIGRQKFNEVFVDIVRDKHSEAMRWMKWHGNNSVQAPPAHEMEASVPQPLSDIVARMMAKNPASRFENMEALGRAIKASFSAKDAPAPMQAPLPHKKHRRHASAAGKSIGAASAAAPGGEAGVLDEASALGPATAPLPKKRMTLKRKLVLAACATFALLATMAVLAINSAMNAQGRANSAKGIYSQADKAYQSADYKIAAERFERLKSEFAGTDEAAMASVMIHLAQGYREIEARNWTGAAQEERLAGEQQRKLNVTAKGDLYKWSQIADGWVREFGARRTTTRDFVTALAKAQDDLNAKNYGAARNDLNVREMASLTNDQKQQLSAMRSSVDQAELRNEIEQARSLGDEAFSAGNYDEATKLYNDGLAKAGDPRTLKILGRDESEKFKAVMEEKVRSVSSGQEVAAIRKEIEEARASNDFRRELEAMERGQAISRNDDWAKRLPELKSMVAMDEGLQAETAGNFAEAREKYVKSKLLFESEQVKEALTRLEKFEKRDALLRESRNDFDAGNYASALAKLEEAMKLPAQANPPVPLDFIKDKIQECQYRIGLAEADKLAEQKNYEAAINKYDSLRSLTKDPSVLDDRIARQKTEQEYEVFRGEGNRALANQEWAKALQQYKLAQGKKDTEEIKDLLKNTLYRQNLSLGNAAFDAGEYASAMGYYNLAMNYAPAEEKKQLQAKIQQAEQRQKSKP